MCRAVGIAVLPIVGLLGCGAVLGITDLSADATGDAGPVADAGAGDASWCAAHAADATFCDDFGGPSLSAGWSSVEASGGGGSGARDEEVFASAPAAFTSRVQPTDAGYTQWCLRKTFDQGGGHTSVVVGFDARIDTLESGNGQANLTLLNLSFAGAGQEHPYALDLNVRADGLHLVEELSSGTVADHPLRFMPAASTWIRMELSLERGDAKAAGTASVRMNGQTVSDAVIVDDPNATGVPTVRLGIPYATGPSAQRVTHVDNVTVSVH